MPDPSQVSAQNINTELGVGSTTLIQLNNNWVRNVATKSSGQISYGNCRWGINFPGRDHTTTQSVPQYSASPLQEVITQSSPSAGGGAFNARARSGLNVYSNGVMRIYAEEEENNGIVASNYFHRTWLTSGANSEYTIQMNVDFGAFTSGNTTNTDIAMSSTTGWEVMAFSTGANQTKIANGNIIIKSSGTEIFRRPFSYIAEAEIVT